MRHLIGTAIGWGGNHERDAVYLMEPVPQNDGKVPYELKVKDVPVDGFWSITVYNAEGFMDPNGSGANALNNVTAKPDADKNKQPSPCGEGCLLWCPVAHL